MKVMDEDLITKVISSWFYYREKPVEVLSNIHLDSLAFLPEWGPSFDGITVKNNFVEIKGKRSFDSR